jgi:hypothetical protein
MDDYPGPSFDSRKSRDLSRRFKAERCYRVPEIRICKKRALIMVVDDENKGANGGRAKKSLPE